MDSESKDGGFIATALEKRRELIAENGPATLDVAVADWRCGEERVQDSDFRMIAGVQYYNLAQAKRVALDVAKSVKPTNAPPCTLGKPKLTHVATHMSLDHLLRTHPRRSRRCAVDG